jgi:1,4-dihydroxy-2-naphthoate octaprenyltransferase
MVRNRHPFYRRDEEMQAGSEKKAPMDPLASRRRAPSPPVRAGRRVALAVYAVVRMALLIALGFGVIWLSIVASVWGLSAVLVALALVGLVALRTVSRVRAEDSPSAARPSRRAFVITAVVLIGFFVLLTLASQIWASH